jgi:diaminobutyrate-2-oxoglutarate transaminase
MTISNDDTTIFTRRESNVRSYCRSFPTVFDRAEGSEQIDVDGRRYIDFFAGAGALNYGHNPPELRQVLIEYLAHGGVTHSLDLHTAAKKRFLESFERVILTPRGMPHKVMFPGPTGTNAVEAALKLARKATGRRNVVTFTNAFHGMTLGSLAVTGNAGKRRGAGVPLDNASVLPFDGYLGDAVDTLDVFEAMLCDPSSGLDKPAAVILETVQAEGGVNVASVPWLQRVQRICRAHGILLVVDDIQAGCGRTGPFFSFERAGLEPDLVTLSKSLSGYGTPLSVVLIRPELDVWAPGEHNGTFRGHNLAFVTATAALQRFWTDEHLSRAVADKGARVVERLRGVVAEHPKLELRVRGEGLMQGLVFARPELAGRVSQACFERGLLIETAGPEDEVLKVLPPLTIEERLLERGLGIIEASVAEVAAERRVAQGVEVTA